MITIKKFTNQCKCNSCASNSIDELYLIKIGNDRTGQSISVFCKDCLQQIDKQIADQLTADEIPVPPHRSKWFEIWMQDKENILAVMHRNLSADLDAGYSYTGKSIQSQLTAIDEYIDEFDAQLISFVGKSNKEVSDWCYYDLKKRGSIE